MKVIVIYKDGSVFTICDVLHFKYMYESVFSRFPGPLFYIEYSVLTPDGEDIECGRIALSDIDSIEVFYDV